jgi:hypothetical protein
MKRCAMFLLIVSILMCVPAAMFAQYDKSEGTAIATEEAMKPLPVQTSSVEMARKWAQANHWRGDSPDSRKMLQDFEVTTFPPAGWALEYTGTQYWSRLAGASGYGVGTASAKFNFWNASGGITQSLVSETFSASFAGDSLLFDYAHAYYDATSIDSLFVQTSTNGGTTWTTIVSLWSSTTPYLSLSTFSSTSLFTPTAGQWGTKRYAVPAGTNKLRFLAKSGFGNNLYIDNVNVGAGPGPLTGTKTIGGTTPDYPNFTSAIAAVDTQGVGAGGVTFLVRPGVYGTDAGTEVDSVLTLLSAPGASPGSPVIFQKASGAVVIERSGTAGTGDYLVLLNGADYHTFDGIDLRQRAGSNAVEFGYVIQNASATDGAQGNTFKNYSVTLNALTNTSTSIAMFMSGTGTTVSGTNSNNKFYNFALSGGVWGFQIFGTLGNPDLNTEIGILPGGTSTISYAHRTLFNGAVGFGNQDNIRVFNVEVTSGFQAGAVSMYCIAAPFAGSAIGTAYIYDNKIHGLVDSSTAGGAARGIATVNLGTYYVYNNRVYDMLHATLTTGTVTGISIENAAAAYVYNNMVSDIKAPVGTGTTTPTIRGISATGGIAANFYNNTVYLNAANTSVSRSSAAFYFTTVPSITDLRNNIFINKSAAGTATTARQAAIIKSSISLANIALTSNNNLLYAGPVAGSTNLRALFWPATGTGDTTLAQYITRMVPMEAAAVTQDVAFRNTTTPPYDIHVDSTAATVVESGGNNAPGVTTDIDGQPRIVALAPNVAPDLGADEFSGITADLVGPTITHTALINTNLTTDRSLTATIKDLVSGVDRRAGLQPRVYYKKNGGSIWTSPAVDSAGVPVGNVWTFTLSSTALGGLVNGDTVYYYIAAADSVGNVSTNPSGGSGLTPPGNVAPLTTYAYRISPALAGTFTIGATGASFTTVKAAFDSINASTVTGAITLDINTDYAGDVVFPISLNAVNYGAGGPFVITLKPATGATPIIQGVSATSIIKLNGADYVTIDGSNSGGTERSLTIINYNNIANTATIWLSSLGAGAGCTNNTIKNLNIRGGSRQDTAANTTWGIIACGATLGTAIDGADNDNNLFTNNAIVRVAYGIFVRGAVANTNDNNTISGNLIGPSAFGPDEIGRAALVVQHQNLATITLNEIRFVGGTFALSSGGRDRVGIGLGSEFWTTTNTFVTNSTVTRNLIHDILDARTFSAVGIVLGSSASPSSNTVANNMIYNITANGTAGDQGLGIGIGAGDGDKVVYNSIAMRDSLDPGAASTSSVNSAGIRIANLNPTVANLTLRNNAISVDVSSKTSTLRHFAIVAPSATFGFGTGVLNNNVYHTNTANPQMALGGIGTAAPYTVQQDLAAWRTQFGGAQDVNSSAADPVYMDPRANVHILQYAASPVDSAASPIAGITIDYDNQTRNATRPDIGADEYTRVDIPSPIITLVARSTRVPVAGDTLVVTCTITDTLGIATASILYASDGVAQTPVTMTRTSGTPQNGTYRGVLPGTANVNGKRIEYRILGLSTSGLSTTTTVTANNSYFAGLSPLSLTGVKAVSGTGQLLYSNYYARVSGTINGPNFQTVNLGYNFQDAVGGIDLFKSGTVTPVLALGDSVIVLGKLAQFRGLTEITPDTVTVDIQIVATGRPVVPLDITVPAFYANPELYESRVLRMTSLRRRDVTPPWPPLGTSANVVMYQGVVTDTIIMRIDSDTEIDGSPEPTYPITVTGVITQFTSTSALYNDGYQTQPRYLTDFSTLGLHDIGVFSFGAGSSPDAPSSNNLSRELFAELMKKSSAATTDASGVEQATANVDEGTDEQSTVVPQIDKASAASISITPIVGASTDYAGDAPLNFRALVRNYGTFAETTYQVGWTIDGTPQTPVNQPRILQVGATDTLTLTWAVPAAGAHIARAFTILASDANRSNDTSAPYNFNVSPEGIVFQEGFNGTIPPYPTGWHVKNRDLGGTSTYFQGNPTVFTAYEGASYIGANYLAANGLYIDEWLVTPNTGGLLANPNAVVDSLIFWQRSPSNQSPYYADSIQIRVSTTDTAVASFTTVLDYFRVDTIGWRRKAYALPTAANRYIAFRYLHYNGGSGAYSNYIGLDAVQISRTFVPTPGWSLQTSGITNQFYSVKAVNATTAWAAALGGRVLRTVDGGNTWTSVGGGRIGAFDIYNIAAVDANTAFVTTTPSTTTYIFRTTNGGAVWDTVFQQAGGFIDAIHMYDANNGIALGDPVPATLWVVLKTTNGGASWSRIATEPVAVGGEAGTQNDLAVSGPNNIWFGSSAGGRVYRSTNAGATWSSSIVPGGATATRVISVWFNGPNYGIAGHYTTSGVYNAARTTDGGVTWSAITVGTGTTYNIAVGGSGNDDFWMARGTDVFRSTNRGATWASSYTGTGTFYDVDFYTSGSSTYGWGVKDNGNIVAAFFTITGVKEDIAEIPQSFNLMQNYPNPFNPTTTLRYGLPKEARVNLSIYNVLGQRIATLKDEVQNVGYYDVVWNGRNDFGSQIASGVYFYRIEAKPVDGGDAFTSIKKMLMLK